LSDGGEVDLDLGNSERYLGVTLTRDNNITTGKIYQAVIESERQGKYLGKTVQVVPHVTNAIQDWIDRVARIPVDNSGEEPDVCIIELGGTVGDIESAPFVEALTQLRHRAGKNNFVQIHVSYVPVINGEQKTKPTQHAVKSVRSAGLIPDLIACRCEKPLEQSTITKVAHHCQMEVEQVLAVRDMPTIYQVPLLLEEQGLMVQLHKDLELDKLTLSDANKTKGKEIWKTWKQTVIPPPHSETLNIALVGKYVEFADCYLSVVKSLEHSAMRIKRNLNIVWVDSGNLEESVRQKDATSYHKAWHDVCSAAGVLVPGGFGVRGTEGMIRAAQYAREKNVPFLGICLGMQIAVISFARDKCGMTHATSEEFQPDTKDDHVIVYMPEISKEQMGGTMRLGLRPTHFQPGSEYSKLRALYGDVPVVEERHRHRYEVNPKHVETLEKAGLNFVGKDDKGERMEILELKDHPYYVGVQYHPEYLSRVLDRKSFFRLKRRLYPRLGSNADPQPPTSASRPYLGFMAASAGCLEKVTEELLAEKKHVNGFVNGVVEGTHF
jgi:CTP synthase